MPTKPRMHVPARTVKAGAGHTETITVTTEDDATKVYVTAWVLFKPAGGGQHSIKGLNRGLLNTIGPAVLKDIPTPDPGEYHFVVVSAIPGSLDKTTLANNKGAFSFFSWCIQVTA
jgi:hypothetical protein